MATSEKEMATSDTELDVVLIGQTGHGKSSTANTILGADVFKESDGDKSETTDTIAHWARRGNILLKVVDTPGVGDTKLSVREGIEMIIEKMSKIFEYCPDGFHVLALVVRYGMRFTANEFHAVNTLKSIFGPNFVKENCVLVVTHGDDFDLHKKKEKCKSFQGWCDKQEGGLGFLIRECQNRVVLFYNLSDDVKKTKSVNEFLSLVQRIGKRYTNEMFNSFKMNRDKLIVLTGADQVKQNLQPQIDIVIGKLKAMTDLKEFDETSAQKLQSLEREASFLKAEIESEDRNTDVLKSLKQSVDIVLSTISNWKEICNGSSEMHKQKFNDYQSSLNTQMEILLSVQKEGMEKMMVESEERHAKMMERMITAMVTNNDNAIDKILTKLLLEETIKENRITAAEAMYERQMAKLDNIMQRYGNKRDTRDLCILS